MYEKKVNLIVAMCNNRGIGIGGNLPWRLKKDMAFFKKVTTETVSPDKQNVVIMGRKTWASIPEKFRPLPGRINVILSSQLKEAPEGCHVARSFSDAMRLVQSPPLAEQVESVNVIGGASVYKEALETCEDCQVFLTRVLADIPCDTFLPEFEDKFQKIDRPPNVPGERFKENDLEFIIEVYEKIKK